MYTPYIHTHMFIFNVVISCMHVYLKNVQGMSARCGSRHSLESVSRIQLAHMYHLPSRKQDTEDFASITCANKSGPRPLLRYTKGCRHAINLIHIPEAPWNYRNYGLEVLALRPGSAGAPGKWARSSLGIFFAKRDIGML